MSELELEALLTDWRQASDRARLAKPMRKEAMSQSEWHAWYPLHSAEETARSLVIRYAREHVFTDLLPTTVRMLVTAGYTSRERVQAATDYDLLAVRGIGISRLTEIRTYLPGRSRIIKVKCPACNGTGLMTVQRSV